MRTVTLAKKSGTRISFLAYVTPEADREVRSRAEKDGGMGPLEWLQKEAAERLQEFLGTLHEAGSKAVALEAAAKRREELDRLEEREQAIREQLAKLEERRRAMGQ